MNRTPSTKKQERERERETDRQTDDRMQSAFTVHEHISKNTKENNM